MFERIAFVVVDDGMARDDDQTVVKSLS